MISEAKGYQLVEGDDEEAVLPQAQSRTSSSKQDSWKNRLIFFILGYSLAVNCYYLTRDKLPFSIKPNQCLSKWAHTEPDKRVTAWNDGSEFTSKNQTKADEAWQTLYPDDGIIALDSAWAASQGLSQSTLVFPWDHSKSIYLLNSHHGFHCLSKIHLSLMEYRKGIEQTQTFEHMLHCLDWLRKDIVCNADDTPLATTKDLEPELNLGAWRKCRDWDAMIDWARQHNSCYRYGNDSAEMAKPTGQWNRFSHCPPGSPYLPAVRKHYGKPDDWMPQNATDLG